MRQDEKQGQGGIPGAMQLHASALQCRLRCAGGGKGKGKTGSTGSDTAPSTMKAQIAQVGLPKAHRASYAQDMPSALSCTHTEATDRHNIAQPDCRLFLLLYIRAPLASGSHPPALASPACPHSAPAGPGWPARWGARWLWACKRKSKSTTAIMPQHTSAIVHHNAVVSKSKPCHAPRHPTRIHTRFSPDEQPCGTRLARLALQPIIKLPPFENKVRSHTCGTGTALEACT